MRIRSTLACVHAAASVMTAPVMAATGLKVWRIPWNAKAHAAFGEMIKDYEAKHPDVTVTDESRGIDEHKTAMRVAANSGQGPDIYGSVLI